MKRQNTGICRYPDRLFEQAMRNVGCLIETPSYYSYLIVGQNLEIIRKLYQGIPEVRKDHRSVLIPIRVIEPPSAVALSISNWTNPATALRLRE